MLDSETEGTKTSLSALICTSQMAGIPCCCSGNSISTTIYDCCCRLLVYSAMMPLLRHVGYGMTWQHCMACVWGGLRGPLSLCLALMVLQTPTLTEEGDVSNFP